MIKSSEENCPNCGGELKYYDHVPRKLRSKSGRSGVVMLRRFRCTKCGQIHREIPNYIFPYKQYEADLIIGVLDGLITDETLGFEDYPCQMTMLRWSSHKLQLLLWQQNNLKGE